MNNGPPRYRFIGPPGEMKLPGGPMIVMVSMSCSTAKTAATMPSQRGKRPSLAANRIGAATMMSATVRMGPHIVTTSVIARAVPEPRSPGCKDNPAVNQVAMLIWTRTTAEPMVKTNAYGPASRSRAWPSTTTRASEPNASSSAWVRTAPECSLRWVTMSRPGRSIPGSAGTISSATAYSTANAMAATIGTRRSTATL
nr:hypothetical protein CPGR_04479 [Mycolicibacterium malmesburyense]